MSREILCSDCDKKMKALAARYGELYESVEGKSKGEYLCDGCGFPNHIHKGDACFAAMLLPDKHHFNYEFQKPENWMNDYLTHV